MVQAIYELPCTELISSMWSEFTQAPGTSVIDVAKWLVDTDQPKVKPISQVVSCLTQNVDIRAGLFVAVFVTTSTAATIFLMFRIHKLVLSRRYPTTNFSQYVTVPGVGGYIVTGNELSNWQSTWDAFQDYKTAFEAEDVMYAGTGEIYYLLRPLARDFAKKALGIDFARKAPSFIKTTPDLEEKLSTVIEKKMLLTPEQIDAYVASFFQTPEDRIFAMARGETPTVNQVFDHYETVLMELNEDEQA